MLNQLFSSLIIVMHLGVTNCYCGNMISGSVLNQSFSSVAIVMNLGVTHCYWGNIISAKSISFSSGAINKLFCEGTSQNN